MTAEQWKQVEKRLKIISFDYVVLKIDGFEVSLALRQVSQFRNAIVVYVNGVFSGKFLTEDCEERRRFFPCKKHCATNANELRKMGVKSKKEIQKLKESLTYDTYLSAWTNFKAMKKHFETNNNSIELVGV